MSECVNKKLLRKPIKLATKNGDYICSYCGNLVGDRFLEISGEKVRIKENFCDICGQEFDWSDDDGNKRNDTMTKTKEFKFRLTEKEFEEMRELAEREGRTMSNLLRYLVAKERKEREK